MNPATLGAAPADATLLRSLFSIGFLARFSYALARNPVLPLFAVALGAGPEGNDSTSLPKVFVKWWPTVGC